MLGMLVKRYNKGTKEDMDETLVRIANMKTHDTIHSAGIGRRRFKKPTLFGEYRLCCYVYSNLQSSLLPVICVNGENWLSQI